MTMQTLKNTKILHFLLLHLILYSGPSIAQPIEKSICGKIKIQPPFSPKTSAKSSPLNRALLCKSEKLYFRTTLGLFHVSSIDYTTKTLTISHSSCSSSLHFISPSILSAGFPSSPQPNSLLLFNCSSQTKPKFSFPHDCNSFYGCKDLSKSKERKIPSSCWFVNDSDVLEIGFHPKDLNCSHYNRVYRNPAFSSTFRAGYELGTRISFGIPDHVPNVCDQCTKPQGNCGVGLRCICHPKECKDKVYSRGVSMNPFGDVLPSVLVSTIMLFYFMKL